MQMGKYQLIHKLATGGMAEVFLAKAAGPMGFEKMLVVKRILPHLATEPAFVEMFLSEARLVAQLNHPNIVQIFDFGESEGTYFIAMEYIDGSNLREIIRRASGVSLSLPLAFCARVVSAACEGLAFAHDLREPATNLPMDIIHRDISPDNILLSRQGAVKVVDFGIAKAAGMSPHTQTGVLKGKLAYMPPEQLRNEPLDRRADVYALGIVLYELLTGLKPFMATSEAGMVQAILFELQVPVAQRRPEVPEVLQRILAQATAKDRERRYPDCASFQAELDEFIVSTGKPMGASQLALLSSMLKEGGEASSPLIQKTSSAPQSQPRFSQSQRLSEPAPAALARPAADSAPVLEGRQLEGREFKGERTSAERPSRLMLRALHRTPPVSNPHPEPVVECPSPTGPRPREKDTVWAAGVGILLVLMGGGFLIYWLTQGPPPVSVVHSGQDAGTRDGGLVPQGLPETPPPVAEVEGSLDAGGPALPIKPDASVIAPVERTPALGTLDLLVVPEAELFLNKYQMGLHRRTRFPLDPGKYKLKLINRKLNKKVEREIFISAGKTTRLDINLLEE
ncbi:serine/threonine-protein kinase [Hyalangium sp.]|uniref:serine/threonine protein kinase n=1 Tax=Hyalangium sp. TaxID=2028555 RepID=UPI002D29BFD1|nr:serine/threonine-protein kinase [Hyalangium sp.]HYI00820.1 serine/threonine-protein kinase [Hyalangium sp.]